MCYLERRLVQPRVFLLASFPFPVSLHAFYPNGFSCIICISFRVFQFCRESLKDLESITERVVVIVCDGSNGRSASLLGLSDEFVQHSCRAYGAVAALERHDQASVPTPEIRVHNLTFDLNAYGNDCDNDPYPQGFHLKIFGSARHRYISLAVPRGESKLVKTLKGILDQSVSTDETRWLMVIGSIGRS